MSSRSLYRRALNSVLIAGAAAALAIPAYTWQAPESDWWGIDQVDRSQVPVNLPTWTPELQHEYPAFVDIADMGDRFPARLVVIDLFGAARVLDFQTAWDRNHDESRANDVWVVGGRA